MCFIHTTPRKPIKLENVEVKPSQLHTNKNVIFTFRSKILCAADVGFSYNNIKKDNQKVVPLERKKRVSIFYNKIMYLNVFLYVYLFYIYIYIFLHALLKH